jgi:hypothetical protein
MRNHYAIQLVIADHGTLGEDGYIGCGMLGIEDDLANLRETLLRQKELTSEQIESYLNNLGLYDLNQKGGIGQHANWETKQLEILQEEIKFESRLAKILPNDLEKEQIPNKRLIITQPYVSQEGLLTNIDEESESFDGSTIIQTVAGLPNVQKDSNLINGLLISSYNKGFSVNEILVLNSVIDLFDQSLTRKLIQSIQQTLNYELKRISEQIATIANLSEEQCYNYLVTIKDSAILCLFGLETDRLNRAKRLAEEIKELKILPKKMRIKYGLVDVNGEIKKQTIKRLI